MSNTNQKPDLQIMLEMWQDDFDNKTKGNDALLILSPYFHGARTVKQGGIVEMGVAAETLQEMAINPDKRMCILLVLDKEEFFKRRNAENNG